MRRLVWSVLFLVAFPLALRLTVELHTFFFEQPLDPVLDGAAVTLILLILFGVAAIGAAFSLAFQGLSRSQRLTIGLVDLLMLVIVAETYIAVSALDLPMPRGALSVVLFLVVNLGLSILFFRIALAKSGGYESA